MTNIKTVPNQKVVRINKEKCGTGGNLFAQIDMNALNKAAQDLDAGAFKLWLYFSKNQHNYEFALSSKVVENEFGIKKKQYDNAIKQLIDKNYLVVSKGNYYIFNEIPVVPKGNNEIKEKYSVVPKGNNDVVSFGNNDVVPKGNNALYLLDTRNNTNNTYNNTNNITDPTTLPTITQDQVKMLIKVEVIDEEKGIIKDLYNNKFYRLV